MNFMEANPCLCKIIVMPTSCKHFIIRYGNLTVTNFLCLHNLYNLHRNKHHPTNYVVKVYKLEVLYENNWFHFVVNSLIQIMVRNT